MHQPSIADLQGRWVPTKAILGGNAFPDAVRNSISLVIEGDRYTASVGPTIDTGMLRLDGSTSPAAMDIVGTAGPNAGKTIPTILAVDGDTVRICYNLGGSERPTSFESLPGSMHFLVTYVRS